MKIPFPIGGVSEDFSLTDQPPLTARDASNVRPMDKTGRLRGSQRAGTMRWPDDPLGGTKVQHLSTVTYDIPNQTFVSAGNSLATEWSASNPVAGDTLGVQVGSQSDVYVIDGPTGIAKLNADKVTLLKISLAADDPSHIVRALLVDANTPNNQGTDLVLAGVSTGGSSLRAKMWAYIQLDDNKTQKLWEVLVGGYVEAFRIHQDKLYVLVNFPERNRSEIIVYDKYLTDSPTEIRRIGHVPYPANEMDISPKDGFIFTCSNSAVPNVAFNRDLNPESPKATLDYVDWQPTDLASFWQRVWGWWDATDLSTLSIDPRNTEFPGSTAVPSQPAAPPPDSNDGGDVRAWLDKSGKGRHWFQTTDQPLGNGSASNPPAARGAIYRSKGIAGKPSLHFDGKSCGMTSEAPSSTDKAFRSEQLSALPSYVGAQFVCCMAVRISQDNTARGLLGWGNTGGSWNNTGRFIAVNSEVTTSATPAVRPGHIYVHEPSGTVSDTSASTPDAPAPTGPNTLPLGAGLPDSGLAIVTWICDGRQQDVFGTATRSLFRVNGHPCDRWQSAAYNTIAATTLGYFAGAPVPGAIFEIGEMIVLSDWYDSNDGIQRLVGDGVSGGSGLSAYKYPDAVWASGGDTEIERLEGYLAHKWGMAHELEGGKVGILHFDGTNVTDGDTVTIGATTYRFKNTIAAANDVHIGADDPTTALNFYRAINTQGTLGVDYHFSTRYNPDVRAIEPAQRADASGAAWQVAIRPRNTFAVALSLSEAGTHTDWAHSTTQDTEDGGGVNVGWYPHPFFIDRTTNTPGGPPRVGGVAAQPISNYWRLRSIYPILAAWDPANGHCRDVLTSNFDGTGTGVGGVGYGVRVGKDGDAIFSCGPRQAAVATLPAILADPVDVRRINWEAQAFKSLTSSASNDVWTWGSLSSPSSPGALGYAYPRMALDKYDNLYLPYYNTSGGVNDSLFGFTKDSVVSVGVHQPVYLFDYSGLTDHNEAYAVAVDPRYPKYPDDGTLFQAEFVVLATRIEAVPTSRSSVFKLRTISSTLTSASPRAVIALGVCGGNMYQFDSVSKKLIASSAFDANAGFIDSFEMNGERFWTDGSRYKRYNPTTATFGKYTSSGPGAIPPRCRIMGTWRQRAVLARPMDNPNQFFLSEQGTADNFDAIPYTVSQIMAIIGSDSPAGIPADIINAWISYNDDLAFIGGDHSILRLTGDPAAGGSIHLVSDSIGIAFGRAWCKSPTGLIYFFASRGSVYMLTPDGAPPVPLSSQENPYRNKIERRLQDIDLSLYFIRMEWNDRHKGFHVIVCPYGAGGTALEHYFWSQTGGWWPDEWTFSSDQPTAICIMDGDLPGDRRVLLGCEDGFVRTWDDDALGDDVIPATGVANHAIDSFVRIGPLAGPQIDMEYMFNRLAAVFAKDQGGPWIKMYSTDVADQLGDPVWQGKMQPGRNQWINFRLCGAYVYIDIQLSDRLNTWALEGLSFAEVTPIRLARSLS